MKIWGITCCKNCVRLGEHHTATGSYDYCYRENRRISNVNKLPKWCTLPDYKGDDKVASDN